VWQPCKKLWGLGLENILIYSGSGAGAESILQVRRLLKSKFKSQYRIKLINPQGIVDGSWQQSCKLLVIPGGADIPYTEALNGAGNNKIRQYVESGGSYLGICAGALE
jgi:biotin--protein ligase